MGNKKKKLSGKKSWFLAFQAEIFFWAEGKRPQAKPSQAEKPSARAMAQGAGPAIFKHNNSFIATVYDQSIYDVAHTVFSCTL